MSAPSANLVAKRKELEEKRTGLANVFKVAGEAGEGEGGLDFQNADVLEMLGASGSMDAVEKVRARKKEIEDLFDEATQLAELEGYRDDLGQMAGDIQRIPEEPRHPDPSRAGLPTLSLGDQVVNHEGFAEYLQNKGTRVIDLEGSYGLRELKATLFQTSAGWAPEDLRTGKLVDEVTRPIQILDIIPQGQTGMSTVLYMEETTRTQSAAEAAEGAAYAEDAFVVAEQSSEVRKIASHIPVTDEQLDDVPMVRGYLNQRLTFGLRQRLDNQIIKGDGTAPNLEGIENVTGIQTQAKGADPVPDAIYKTLTKVRVTGRAFPSHVLMHQNDWQGIRLLRTADGIYIWGSPADAGVERIWGLPVVQSDVLSEGTGVVGDFNNFCVLVERRGVEVTLGYIGDQFKQGKITIRADLRVAFVTYRGAAFATVTGI